MELKEYFKRIYEPLPSDAFTPSRKNGGILVHFFFKKGGSRHYPCDKKILVSSDVSGERKLFDGSRNLNQEMKNSFPRPLPETLTDYVEGLLNKTGPKRIAQKFGIPPETQIIVRVLAKALVSQFLLYLDSDEREVSDIVSEEYGRFFKDVAATRSEHVVSRYPDDRAYLVRVTPQSIKMPLYTDFKVTWEIQNTGRQTWKGRKLFFLNWNNHGVRPKATPYTIDIPVVEPGETIKITASMNTRGKQGATLCEWIMIDEINENCFPGSTKFYITVTGVWDYLSTEKDVEDNCHE